MNYKYTILLILILTIVVAQQKNETIEFDAKTGKEYKVIVTQHFDPMTGEMISKRDTVYISNNLVTTAQPAPEILLEKKPIQFSFDPVTGLEVKSNDLTVISLARANAKRNFQKAPWLLLGGPATCGTMIMGGTAGATAFGTPGFLIGTVGMGIITPKVLSHVVQYQPIVYPESINFREHALYEEHYKKEIKTQRSTTIYNSALATCGITAVLGFLMLMSFMS